MSFRVAKAPGIFQELMSLFLHGLGDFTMAYRDDIMIFGASEEEHKQHIQKNFDCLRQHNLKSKLSKCRFMQREKQYMGFIISEDGIMADPDKVRWWQMLPPTCVREVRNFIGMCSYYRRFVPNFSAIAKPLLRLTKKFAQFEWSKECQAAFDFLKDSLTTVPILAYPDISKPFILYSDARDDCIGACLCQE